MDRYTAIMSSSIRSANHNLEARVGFEPTDGGFADLSLRPLGYRAGCNEYNETASELSVVSGTRKFEKFPLCGFILRRTIAGQTSAAHRDGEGTTWASRMNRADSSAGGGQM